VTPSLHLGGRHGLESNHDGDVVTRVELQDGSGAFLPRRGWTERYMFIAAIDPSSAESVKACGNGDCATWAGNEPYFALVSAFQYMSFPLG